MVARPNSRWWPPSTVPPSCGPWSLAIADAEHGHAGSRGSTCGARGAALVEHRGRAAGQDHRLRLHLVEGRFGLLERHDLGIDALLAHPARDQLRHLTAEIDDQNLVMRRGHGWRRLAGCLGWGHGKQIRDGRQARNPPRRRMSRPIHVVLWQRAPPRHSGAIAASNPEPICRYSAASRLRIGRLAE